MASTKAGSPFAVHGGASEKKEIDPNNRASVVLGSVAYYINRYGYGVLPLALRLLAGETLPPGPARVKTHPDAGLRRDGGTPLGGDAGRQGRESNPSPSTSESGANLILGFSMVPAGS